MPRRKPTLPSCPRCGYDQSGAIATWTDACPIHGQCSECGLEFRWLHIFHPDHDRIRGFVEHARGFRSWLGRTLPTLLLVLRPHVFWARVTLADRPRPVRAGLWVATLVAATWVLMTLFASVDVFAQCYHGNTGSYSLSEHLVAGLLTAVVGPIARAHPDLFFDLHGPPAWCAIAFCPGIASLFWPFMIAMLSSALSARIRAAHIARAAAYSFLWLPVLLLPFLCAAVHDSLAAIDGVIQSFPGYGTLYPHHATELEYDPVMTVVLLGFMAAFLVWLPIWWHATLIRGFELARGRALWGIIASLYFLMLALASVPVFIVAQEIV